MMISKTIGLLGIAASTLTLAANAPRGGDLEIGSPAPEIDGKVWLNHLGDGPSLASLRGQAVLIEFWATW